MTTVTCSQCSSSVSNTAQFCPDCGARVRPGRNDAEVAGIVSSERTATRKRINHNNGGGCLVALLGLCFIWFFPVGTIAGVLLIWLGSRMSYKFVCSTCGNSLEASSRLCPACKAVIAD